MWLSLIPSVVKEILGYFSSSKETKTKLKNLKEQNRITKAKLTAEISLQQLKNEKSKISGQQEILKTVESGNLDLDRLNIINNRTSYKDELILVVVLSPLIGVFIPSLSGYVNEGFAILDNMPLWYIIILQGVVIGTLGIRGVFSSLLKLRHGNK